VTRKQRQSSPHIVIRTVSEQDAALDRARILMLARKKLAYQRKKLALRKTGLQRSGSSKR